MRSRFQIPQVRDSVEASRRFMHERAVRQRKEALKAWDKACDELRNTPSTYAGYLIDWMSGKDRCIKYHDAAMELQVAFQAIGFYEGVSPLGVAAGGRL